MNYPNVKKGIGKLYLGELLVFLGAVLGVGALIILTLNHVDVKLTGEAIRQHLEATGMLVPFVVYAVGTVLLFLAGLILTLAGITQSSHDEESFKRALWAVLLNIAIHLANSFLQQKNPGISKWLEVASTVCTMMTTLLVIGGIGEVAEKIGDREMCALTAQSSKIVLYPFILSAVAELLVALLNLNQSSVAMFNIAIGVLDVVSYIVFLRVLYKAKIMLR